MLLSVMHAQAWVRVNAQVDGGIAEAVRLLNEIPGLQTIQSCQGETGGRQAYIYFSYGPWEQLCRFVFEKLAPALRSALDDDAVLSVEVFGGGPPMGKLTFSPEATTAVTSGLRHVLMNDRS